MMKWLSITFKTYNIYKLVSLLICQVSSYNNLIQEGHDDPESLTRDDLVTIKY